MQINMLPKNFTLSKYGIDVRFVKESDAAFILELRTDSRLSRYLHKTENDLEKQKEWIQAYKQREAQGKEYYFIYEQNGVPIGVNRLYNITDTTLTGGSWLCKKDIPYNLPPLISIIGREIIFDFLKYDSYQFDVRKKNAKVLKFHLLAGSKIISESGIDYYLTLNKDDFNVSKQKLLKLLLI